MSEPTKLESALDELLTGKTTEEIVGPGGLLKQLTKALIERAMNAEMSHHLGYEKHAPEGRGSGNNRNGKSRKKVQGGLRRGRDRSSSRPQRDLRPQDRSQTRASLLRLRRENPVDVRARHEYARHP